MPTFQVEGATRTFEAGSAIVKGRRVTFNTDGKVDHSTNVQAGIGVALRAAAADGDPVPVRLWSAEVTWQVEASGVIGQGVALEGAADGKFAAVGGAGVDLPLFNISVATAADTDVFEAAKLLTGIV